MIRVLVAYFSPWARTLTRGASATPNAVTLSESLNIALFMKKKGAIASRRLDFYLLVHGRYFISLLPPIGNQWRRSPIRHLGTRPLGVTGSPEGTCSGSFLLGVPSGAPPSKKPTKEYLFRIGIVAAMFQKRRPCNSQTKRTGNDSNTLSR
ncbi:hypothetical protein TNCV_3669251 [Trichonephila clavipes]|nr:hypothetical protein TNCV_3669251 [Trichonephila clavipes]